MNSNCEGGGCRRFGAKDGVEGFKAKQRGADLGRRLEVRRGSGGARDKFGGYSTAVRRE